MQRNELIEWIVIIVTILAWWPNLFLGYSHPVYDVVIYAAVPIVLVVILIRRYRRMQEGFELSRRIVDAQHQATGANVLGQPPRQPGTQPLYPGVVLPDEVDLRSGARPSGDEQAESQVPPEMPNFPNIPGLNGTRPDEDQETE